MLLTFDDAAQASYEACYPATVSFPGYEDVACAGGAVRQLSATFLSGGKVGDYDLAFRVRKDRVGGAMPEVGKLLTFQGKRWRIMRAAAPECSVAFTIHCSNPQT